jgi:deoxyguanosine kinase
MQATEQASAGFFLAIEGPIGVGKTTLAQLLHARWPSDLLLERFDDNPFLALFYADPERYALPTQLHFLLDRFDQLTETPRTQGLLISDYVFAKDRLFAELNLSPAALRRYRKVYDLLAPAVPQPDAVVFLHADETTLLDRIARRGRSYEQQLAPAYLRRLAEAYHGFFTDRQPAPALYIDSTSLDLAARAADQAAVIARINDWLAQLRPAPAG